jgi:hypothetical protein
MGSDMHSTPRTVWIPTQDSQYLVTLANVLLYTVNHLNADSSATLAAFVCIESGPDRFPWGPFSHES